MKKKLADHFFHKNNAYYYIVYASVMFLYHILDDFIKCVYLLFCLFTSLKKGRKPGTLILKAIEGGGGGG